MRIRSFIVRCGGNILDCGYFSSVLFFVLSGVLGQRDICGKGFVS